MGSRNLGPPTRLLLANGIAAVLVIGALTGVSSAGEPNDGSRPGLAEPKPHTHDDITTKNALSRAGEVGQGATDPTTAAQRRDNTAYVDRQRKLARPTLTTVPVTGKRTFTPRTRYAMANGCYTLRTAAGVYVKRSGDALVVRRQARRLSTRFFFKATDLGTYLMYDARRDFLTGAGGSAQLSEGPSTSGEWTVRAAPGSSRRYSFTNGAGKRLGVAGRTVVTGDRATSFAIERVQGCRAYPESQINIVGNPHAGVSSFQEVRGYIDAHTHGMAYEFLGGEAHCGKPWDEYGAPYALVDCEDHTATGGYGAVLETLLSGEPGHDPVGWPTFVDWPAPNSLTHEGTYYRWIERAWRGGQRIFVNLLVENNVLCTAYPLKRNSCDDMDSVRLQAKRMYEFQDYIDAQFGGPGKGFYRIVKNPFQARKVINAGKLAVVMGIETSIPFGCTMKLDVPQCDAAAIDDQLDEVHKLGVRQMELVNKFDNALAGVAGDAGQTGVAVNNANFAETGSYWDMRHCEPADGESHDRNQLAAPDISAGQQDALFGAIAMLGLPAAIPIYPTPDHCNRRGLTTLGGHTIKELAERKMIFDPDHMSVKARRSALDQIERLGYHGVVSSHSWSTPDAYPRVYQLGGFITPYAGDSTGFVKKWRQHLGWADKRFYWGIGFGADINGLGAQGTPRGADVPNPVTYPFRGINGVEVARQHAGRRTFDINVDGVAQYGLYPDWIEDLRKVARADGSAIVSDLARGAEAYLQMWERAEGVAPDSCRNPGLRKAVTTVESLVRRGMTTRAVMRRLGQPFTRLGTSYGYCARTAEDPRVMVRVRFSRGGTVTGVRR